MNYIVLVLILLSFSSDLTARRRPKYLNQTENSLSNRKRKPLVSPFIKDVTKENQKLTEELQQLEYEAQEELDRAQKQSQKIYKDQLKKEKRLQKEQAAKTEKLTREHKKEFSRLQKELQKKYDNEMKELNKRVSEQIQEIKIEAKEKEAQLALETKKATLKKINAAEMQLLEKYLGIKHKDAVIVKKDDLAKKELDHWKEQQKTKLSNSISYLSPIVEEDDELYELIQQKKMAIETRITDTQQMHDEQYQAAMHELKPIILAHSAQQAADEMIMSNMQTIDMSEQDRNEIRFILFADLQPLIQEAIRENDRLTREAIRPLIIRAISEIRKKPLSPVQVTIAPVPKMALMPGVTPAAAMPPVSAVPPVSTIDKSAENELRERLALLEQRFLGEQEKRSEKSDRKSEQLLQANTTIEKLRQDFEHLQKKNLVFKKLAQTTRNKLTQMHETDELKLQQLQSELFLMSNNFENQNKELANLAVLFKKQKKDLEGANLARREKRRQIKKLEIDLNQARQDLIKNQVEAKRIYALQNELQTIELSFTDLQAKHKGAQRSLTQAQNALSNLKQEKHESDIMYKQRSTILLKEKALLEKENNDLQQQWHENAQLRNKIEELSNQVRLSKSDARKASLKERLETKRKILLKEQLFAQLKKEDDAKKKAAVSQLMSRINNLTHNTEEGLDRIEKLRIKNKLVQRRRLK